MCELLGLSFARPIPADFSIRPFALRATDNADGWGLAWYPDRSVALLKEPLNWQASQITTFLETYSGLLARIYIAHVRHKTTGGEATHADTHPFARELAGRNFCFAHNGTLEGAFWQLPLGRFHPIGNTDSEFLFCHLLGLMETRGELLKAEAGWRWLAGELVTLNRHGKLNALLSDGVRLFCYHDAAGFKGLHFRQVHLRDNEIRRFEDASVRIDLAEEDVNHGFVIATHPLSSTAWQHFRPGEMIVLEDGRLRFSSQRDDSFH